MLHGDDPWVAMSQVSIETASISWSKEYTNCSRFHGALLVISIILHYSISFSDGFYTGTNRMGLLNSKAILYELCAGKMRACVLVPRTSIEHGKSSTMVQFEHTWLEQKQKWSYFWKVQTLVDF